MPLTSEQQHAVDMATRHDISVLYGAPGTGKTYTLKAILDRLSKDNRSVALAAPTGKAAKRMSEATGIQATTIHRLLEPWMDGYEFKFKRNESSPIRQDTVIIDECGMMDNRLAAAVMRALVPAETAHKYDNHKGHKLVLVGDNYQLPSVGPGSVLRDVIESGAVPKTELTQIQRNAGSIVKACHKIKAGKNYEPDAKLDIEAGLNLRHLQVRDPRAIQDTILTVIDKVASEGYDPVWDVQVLAPTNEKGELSCKAINARLQKVLNPNAPAAAGWAKGDKVINIQNMDGETVKGGKKVILVNGDMGMIKQIPADGNRMVCRFFDPDREVWMPKKTSTLLHAYCCTVHRFQGSETPIVIIPVHPSNAFLIDRPWIYTAISRAGAACITIGDAGVIWQAVRKTASADRKTFLKEKLCENSLTCAS